MESINAVEIVNKLALYLAMETARQKIEGDKWAKILAEPTKHSMIEVAHAHCQMDIVNAKLDTLLNVLEIITP